MSKLLIQESPLTFQPSLAVAIGLNEAIVLQQIHYWINNKNNKGYEQGGYKWVYNTYPEWKEQNFPFWSENTIQRVFTSLEEMGLVVSIQPMKGKYDRTKYYRIDYTKLGVFEDTKSSVIDDPNLVCSLNDTEITAENTQPATIEKQKPIIPGIEASIYSNRPTTTDDLPLMELALTEFHAALSLPHNWNWYPAKTSDESVWRELREFILKEWQKDDQTFRKYAKWRATPYMKGALSNVAIQRRPAEFITSWSDYLASSSMYGNNNRDKGFAL